MERSDGVDVLTLSSASVLVKMKERLTLSATLAKFILPFVRLTTVGLSLLTKMLTSSLTVKAAITIGFVPKVAVFLLSSDKVTPSVEDWRA